MAPNRSQRGNQNFTETQRLFMLESDMDDNDIAIINRFKQWEDQWNKFEMRLQQREEKVEKKFDELDTKIDKDVKDVKDKIDESKRLNFGVLAGISASAVLLAINIIMEVAK